MESSANTPLTAEKLPTQQSTSEVPKPPTQGQVLMKLFYHSIAMFSLPFIAYFYSKRLAEESYGLEETKSIIYASISAVIMIQVVIFSYVYQAFKEEQIDRKIKALSKKD